MPPIPSACAASRTLIFSVSLLPLRLHCTCREQCRHRNNRDDLHYVKRQAKNEPAFLLYLSRSDKRTYAREPDEPFFRYAVTLLLMKATAPTAMVNSASFTHSGVTIAVNTARVSALNTELLATTFATAGLYL